MSEFKKGYIQIYTGNGKGKSTAAIGQVIRSAGYGLKTYYLMMMKDFAYNEIESLKRFEDLIEVVKIGKDDWVFRKEKAPQLEIEKAKLALEEAMKKMLSGNYNIIVLDEVFVSIYFGLISVEDVLPFFNQKPLNVELILTGRYCPQEFIERADLVTEMKEIKHYYQIGVASRRGIES